MSGPILTELGPGKVRQSVIGRFTDTGLIDGLHSELVLLTLLESLDCTLGSVALDLSSLNEIL